MLKGAGAKKATRWIPGAAGGIKGLLESGSDPGVLQLLPVISMSMFQRQREALSMLNEAILEREAEKAHRERSSRTVSSSEAVGEGVRSSARPERAASRGQWRTWV